MKAKILDGKELAGKIKEELREKVAGLSRDGKTPSLSAVQVGENPASRIYVKNQARSCEELGIGYKLHELPDSTGEEELLKFIRGLNGDEAVTGIILQMPLPEGLDARRMQREINPGKDVEGIHPSNIGALVYGQTDGLIPCTAAGAMELLKSSGVELKGKEVTIVGHSEIVGKPLTLLFLASMMESATPTVCHIATRELASHTRGADILMVAVGKPGLIRGDMVKEGAIVIDIGINRVPLLDEDGKPVLKDGKKKMRTVGDVAFEEAAEKASYISPVPGGVGPLTTIMILNKTVMAVGAVREPPIQ